MTFDPIIALLVDDRTLIDAAPVFDQKSLDQLEALAVRESKDSPKKLIKLPARKVIDATQTSPLVLAAKELVKIFDEQAPRLREVGGDSIRFQMVAEAVLKLKAAIP
jgi:hypothetical protein